MLAVSRNGNASWDAGHMRQVMQHGAYSVLRVVDAKVAILVGQVKTALEHGAIPVGEVLRVRLRVLQRGQKQERPLQVRTVSLVPLQVGSLASDAARLS